MAKSKPVKMLCVYRPKRGKENELSALLERHWSTLKKVGLVTNEPATVYRATDKRSGKAYFVEIFSWVDSQSSTRAHDTPEVTEIWKPMESIIESMELAEIEPVSAIVEV